MEENKQLWALKLGANNKYIHLAYLTNSKNIDLLYVAKNDLANYNYLGLTQKELISGLERSATNLAISNFYGLTNKQTKENTL